MTNVVFTYMKDGKLRVVVRTIDEASTDEILHVIDKVSVT